MRRVINNTKSSTTNKSEDKEIKALVTGVILASKTEKAKAALLKIIHSPELLA